MTRRDEIWFPQRRFGWGWGPPRTWQGWLALGLYMSMLAIGIFGIDPDRQAPLFFGWLAGWTLAFLAICYAKGERPRWRWDSRR